MLVWYGQHGGNQRDSGGEVRDDLPALDERRRRLMGAEARALGHGGIRLVARAAGGREATVSLGVDELDSAAGPRAAARRQTQAGRPGSRAAPGAVGPGRAGRAKGARLYSAIRALPRL